MKVSLHKKSQIVKVDLSKTIGQESAIEANGSSIFEIKVTVPAVDYDGNAIAGFGRVVSSGPVSGFEVLYTGEAVVR